MITVYGVNTDPYQVMVDMPESGCPWHLADCGGGVHQGPYSFSVVLGHFTFLAPDYSGLTVHAAWFERTCHIGLGKTEPGQPFPPWSVQFKNAQAEDGTNIDTAVVQIDAPAGTRLDHIRWITVPTVAPIMDRLIARVDPEKRHDR